MLRVMQVRGAQWRSVLRRPAIQIGGIRFAIPPYALSIVFRVRRSGRAELWMMLRGATVLRLRWTRPAKRALSANSAIVRVRAA
jgi:hypothetical protein